MPKGENSEKGTKGWTKATPKPAKAPTATLGILSANTPKEDKAQPSPVDQYETFKSKTKKEGRSQVRSVEEYKQSFLGFGVDPLIASKAAEVLANNTPFLLATSGKLASGKDTIAEAVMKEFQVESQHHLSFAAPLKDEAQEVLGFLRSSSTPEEAVQKIVDFDVPLDKAWHIVDIAYEPANAYPDVNTRDRTPWVRLLLQYWGVEVRREKNPDYWRNKAILAAAENIASEKHIMVTDARFPGEVEALQEIGFTVVRLEISPETQARRLGNRDGLAVDPKALVHETETALDNFTGYNLVVDNNEKSIEETVSYIVSKLK